MLKKRVIPTLLMKNMGLVKGISFDSSRRVGSILPSIRVYNTRDVDELIVLDVESTLEKNSIDYDEIKNFSQDCFVPLTYGGGINSIEQIRKVLLSGADKVSINSSCYSRKNLISEASSFFGSQCIVGSIDFKKNNGQYTCYSHSGTKNQEVDPIYWAKELENLGAGEIILTSIDLDGTMKGFDIDIIHSVATSVNIPVIASGGAGSYADFIDVIKLGKADAVAAASVFHFTEITPREVKKRMHKSGISVRIDDERI